MSDLGHAKQLKVECAVMAADITLMALIRTVQSIISSEFTIYEIIERMQESSGDTAHDLYLRRAGLNQCGLGVICTTVGMMEYFMPIRDIKAHYRLFHGCYSLGIARLRFVLGAMIFVSIWTRFP